MIYLWIGFVLLFAALIVARIRWRQAVAVERLRRIVMRTHGQERIPLAKLEAILQTPKRHEGITRKVARHDLAYVYLRANRYADAEAQCRLLLTLRLKPGFEALVRKRLADALEGQNRNDEALQERQKSAEKSAGDSPDFAQLLAKGQGLKRENKYAEAYQVFEQAESVAKIKTQRILILVNKALAAFEAGKYADAVRDSEAALAAGATGKMALHAHRSLSLGLSNLGRREEALQHREDALQIARILKNPDEIANSLALLGELKMQMGFINEAMQLCEEALQTSSKGRGQAYLLQMECLKAWGRFDEALAALERSTDTTGFGIPSFERRRLALHELGKARIYADKGDADAAWVAINAAQEAFSDDAKLNLWCMAERTRIAAMQGDREQSRSDQEFIVTALKERPDDRTTHLVCEANLAQAMLLCGEFAESEAVWQGYLARDPAPMGVPKAWYFIGMARAGLGDTAGARLAFEKSVSALPEANLYHARLAEKQLAQS